MTAQVPGPTNFNPFHEVSSWLGGLSKQGKENRMHQETMHAIAMQHQAHTENTLIQHHLGEQAKESEFGREQKRHRMQMSGRLRTMKLGAEIARGGGQVSAGDVSINLPRRKVTGTATAVNKPRPPRKVRARGGY